MPSEKSFRRHRFIFCIKGGQRSKLIFGMVNLRKNNGFKFEKNRLKAMFQTA